MLKIDDNDVPNVLSEISRKILEAQENVIKDVLRNLLGREPTIEDAKKCQHLHVEGEHDWFYFAYCNAKLGIIRTEFNLDKGQMKVVFEPCSEEERFGKATIRNGSKLNFKGHGRKKD